MRWRRRGAWLWPVFIAATATDAVVGTLLPMTGESEAVVGAGLVGLVLNVIGVILLSRPVGMLVRRLRPDMPMIVARDYGGTAVVCVIAVLLAAAGLAHRHAVTRDRSAMRDATARAQAFIGDRAPAEFRRNVKWVSMFAIQPGTLYRACVPGQQDGRTYCVIVDEQMPLARSVRFSGYEPNSLFSEGAG
jgi:hypothetical protein